MKRIRRCVAILAPAMIAACLPLAATAQQAEPAPPESAEAAGLQLEEIVVTARRREEALQETPVSVSAFSGEALERMNLEEMNKVAVFAPNLDMSQTSTSHSMSVSVRGIATYDPILTNEPSVGVYFDGVYINALTSGIFDVVDLERVEVLRGPQGTLFGRNTTGGAMSLVTRKPAAERGFTQKTGFSSFNTFQSRSTADVGEFAPGWTAKLVYQYRKRDGYLDDISKPENEDPGALTSNAFGFALRGEIGERLTLDWFSDYNRRRERAPTSQFSAVSSDYAAYFANSPALGGDVLRVSPDRLDRVRQAALPLSANTMLGHALTLTWDISDTLTLKSISAYRDWSSDEANSFGSSDALRGYVITDFTTGAGEIRELRTYIGTTYKDANQFSQELQVLGESGRFHYVAGLFYFDNRYEEANPQDYTFVLSSQAAIVGQDLLAYEGKTRSYAAFGQVSYKPPVLDERMELTLGLRQTRDEKDLDTRIGLAGTPRVQADEFDNTSWNSSLNLRISDDVMAFGRVGTGYRAGGFSPRAFTALSYEPEEALAYELGLKSEWFDHRLRMNAALFYTNYDDLQTTVPVFNPGTGGYASNVVNAGKATYQGLELEMVAVVTEGLIIDASFGYTDPEYKEFLQPDLTNPDGPPVDVKDEAKFPYMSKTSWHAGAAYEFAPLPFGVFSLRADYSYKSGRVFEPVQTPLNPYRDATAAGARRELSAAAKLSEIQFWGSSTMEMVLWGENLTNQEYRESGIDFGVLGFATNTYAKPLSVGFDVIVKF